MLGERSFAWRIGNASALDIDFALAIEQALTSLATSGTRAVVLVPAVALGITKSALRAPLLAAMAREATTFDRGVQTAWGSPEVRDAVRVYVEKTLGR